MCNFNFLLRNLWKGGDFYIFLFTCLNAVILTAICLQGKKKCTKFQCMVNVTITVLLNHTASLLKGPA